MVPLPLPLLDTDPFTPLTHAEMDLEILRKVDGGHDDVGLYDLLSYVDVDVKSARDVQGEHLDLSIMLMLECRGEAFKCLLRRALEDECFRHVRLLECLWPPRHQRSTRWLTISFIRHAQCFGNVLGPHTPNADVLTPLGETQTRILAAKWSMAHIDRVHCSTLNRAKRTAAALTRERPEIGTPLATRWLVERNAPSRPKRTSSELVEGHEFLAASSHAHAGVGAVAGEDWRDEPPDGYGETYADVAARGVHYLLCLFSYHGITLPPHLTPTSNQLESLNEHDPASLPPHIPHIVVVAHNFILCELYEALLSWNEDEHCATNADFGQTGWSRHVLCLKGGEREGVGGRGRLYGRMEQTIVRHPAEYSPEKCSPGESHTAVKTLTNTPTRSPNGSGIVSPSSVGSHPARDIPLIAA